MTIRPTPPITAKFQNIHLATSPENRFDLPTIHATPPWMQDGRCRDLPPEQADALFFPSKGNTAGGTQNRARLCGPCPVRETCYEYGVENASHGYWGGRKVTEMKNARDVRHLRSAQATA